MFVVLLFTLQSLFAMDDAIMNCLSHANRLGAGPETAKFSDRSGSMYDTAMVSTAKGEMALVTSNPAFFGSEARDNITMIIGGKKITYDGAAGCRVMPSDAANTMDYYDRYYAHDGGAADQLRKGMEAAPKASLDVPHLKQYCEMAIRDGTLKPTHAFYKVLVRAGVIPPKPVRGSEEPATQTK